MRNSFQINGMATATPKTMLATPMTNEGKWFINSALEPTTTAPPKIAAVMARNTALLNSGWLEKTWPTRLKNDPPSCC